MTDPEIDLTIPEEAEEFRFYCSCGCGRMGFQLEGIDFIVAAELQRLAAEISDDHTSSSQPYWVERHDDGSLSAEMVRQIDRIEARAAELRGES